MWGTINKLGSNLVYCNTVYSVIGQVRGNQVLIVAVALPFGKLRELLTRSVDIHCSKTVSLMRKSNGSVFAELALCNLAPSVGRRPLCLHSFVVVFVGLCYVSIRRCTTTKNQNSWFPIAYILVFRLEIQIYFCSNFLCFRIFHITWLY